MLTRLYGPILWRSLMVSGEQNVSYCLFMFAWICFLLCEDTFDKAKSQICIKEMKIDMLLTNYAKKKLKPSPIQFYFLYLTNE